MRKRSRFFISSWLAVALYCALIFFLASLRNPIPFLDPKKYPPDWILHIVEYTVLGRLLAMALALPVGRRSGIAMFLAALALGVLCAFLDEWRQSFVPGRESGFHDVLADTLGVLAGIVWWFFRKKPNEWSKGV